MIDPKTGEFKREKQDDIVHQYSSETVLVNRDPVFIYPSNFGIKIDSETQIRRCGIFTVPVYPAEVEIAFDFDPSGASKMLLEDETLLWDRSEIRLYLTKNQSLRRVAEIGSGTKRFTLDPLVTDNNTAAGIHAKVDDPRLLEPLTMWLGLNAADSLSAMAVGRLSKIKIKSTWPEPSFQVAFLPDSSQISENRFSAEWPIPHLARNLPPISRINMDAAARAHTSMGVTFYQTTNFYKKAYRSTHYGILFIAMTLLTVLLLDRTGERLTHSVQYLLIGLAQAIFILLKRLA